MHDVCNIYEAKIRLAKELPSFDKVKNNDQIKALVDFLEYLFLFQNSEMEKKYEEYKNANGGVLKLSIEEIRKLHYKEEGKIEMAIEMLKNKEPMEKIIKYSKLNKEEIIELRDNLKETNPI